MLMHGAAFQQGLDISSRADLHYSEQIFIPHRALCVKTLHFLFLSLSLTTLMY